MRKAVEASTGAVVIVVVGTVEELVVLEATIKVAMVDITGIEIVIKT